MRVLIVDDHILFRQGLVSLLHAEADFEVAGEAGCLADSLEQVRLHKPDMVLMDFELPDGTGVEATRAILAEHPTCLIIFLTVHTEEAKLIEAVRSGAKGYLLKSTPIDKLLIALRSVQHGEAAVSRLMTTRIMEELANSDRRPAQPSLLGRLTERERQILDEIATGATNREIAQRLFITENTVKHHIHNLLEKLEVSNRHAAVEQTKHHP